MNTPNMAILSSVSESRHDPAKAIVEPTQLERRPLDAYIQRGKNERFSMVLNVTPGLASAMLTHNIGNRTPTEDQILKHVGRLQRGEFILHHHGISFAKTGVLNDGQHRLIAIARSGIAAQLQVTFGAEREEFGVIDQGRSRTTGQLLGMAGYRNANTMGSTARTLMQVTVGQYATRDVQRVVEYAKTLQPDVMDAAIHMAMRHQKVCGPTPVAVAYYWIATRSSHADKLPAFFQDIPSGESLTHPKLRLRNWLIQPDNLSTSSGGTQVLQIAAAVINAWNAWLAGRKTFTTAYAGTFNLPEPK